MVGAMVGVDSWSESAAVYLKEYGKLYVARKGASHAHDSAASRLLSMVKCFSGKEISLPHS